MDLTLALMCGIDIPIPQCQVEVHQPTIKEIAFLGEPTFFQAVQCLTINKNMLIGQDNFDSSTLNNFQIFMMVMNEKETVERKQDVLALLSLLFPKYKVNITPRSIVLSREGNITMIDESNFESFQQVMKEIFCLNSNNMQSQTAFNPQDAKAKEISDKLMRGRQRIAAEKGNDNANIITQYISVLTVGVSSMPLQKCITLTLFQLFDLIERYNLFIGWDIDIKSRLAGAHSDDKLDNWMKNIHT